MLAKSGPRGVRRRGFFFSCLKPRVMEVVGDVVNTFIGGRGLPIWRRGLGAKGKQSVKLQHFYPG